MKYFVLFLGFFVFQHGHTQTWNLIWEDNFNGPSLDTAHWNYETGIGVNGDWGTGQIDRATDRIENVSFTNSIPGADSSCLTITTREEFYIDRNYTSGRINTQGKVSFGPGHRIVARVFARDVRSIGQGFAFWLLPDETPQGYNYIMWPQGGEIDIMEYVGAIPYHNLSSVHYAYNWENNQWQQGNHNHQGFYYSYEDQEVPDPESPGYGNYPPPMNHPYTGSGAFHNYGVDWYEDRLEFFIDSFTYHIHYFTDGDAFAQDDLDESAVQILNGNRTGISEFSNHFSEWHPFEHQMFMIISAGVGGSQYTYGGPIDGQAQFPCSVFIDWVRVYDQGEELSVSSVQQQSDLTITPNPASETIYISDEEKVFREFKIYSIQGEHILTSSQTTIDISALREGVYFLMATDSNGNSIKRKFIKE